MSDLTRTTAELQAAAVELKALLDLRAERRRARDLANGGDPNRPRRTIDEIRAETIALRAQNDQADAERQGRWRTID